MRKLEDEHLVMRDSTLLTRTAHNHPTAAHFRGQRNAALNQRESGGGCGCDDQACEVNKRSV
ncbi:hypothetical protein ABZX92_16585 [Lentzea sp. NPDC006480]|uniref:hypothetical protein n=1 Tax=Lentzea sp. NPDC006480 TaxID=3157176 RepID=UPI0033A3C2B4